MPSKKDPIAEIQSTLAHLRKQPETRNRFPKEVWKSIIHLAKLYSIDEVSERLQIPPAYLRRKIQSLEIVPLEFREVSPFIQSGSSDSIIIELSNSSGLKAKIQGPLSITSCLQALFKD